MQAENAPQTQTSTLTEPETSQEVETDSKPSRPAESFSELAKLRPIHSWLAIFTDLASIAFFLTLTFYFPEPWLIIISGFFIARNQYALGVLGHDAAHWRLFKNRPFNQMMGRICFNGGTMLSYDGYRRNHNKHHYHLMTDDDPDYKFVEHFPLPLRKLMNQFLLDCIGMTWLYLFLYYGWHGFKEQKKRVFYMTASLLPGIVVNAALFSIYWYLNAPWLYVFCWLLPMLVIMPVLMHIRGITEHAMLAPCQNEMYATRTVINPIQTYFIAPHNLNYHMEHHAYPGIPQYNLPALHKRLKDSNDLPLENLYGSYLPILKQLIKGKTAKVPEPAEQS